MLDRALGLAESTLVRGLKLEPRWPPLFIVGAPRSGTTLVYLHLVNAYRFAYVPNTAREHHPAALTYTAIHQGIHPYEPDYEPSYGHVEGPMGPSDGWELFHRWFPKYDHDQPVRTHRLDELATIVALLERIFDAPFLNKNNNNSTRIGHLAELFDDALFVHVDRDLRDTSASLLEARRQHGVELGEWWSAAPPDRFDESFDSELEQVVATIESLREHIRRDLEELDDDRWIETTYEAFCEAPEELEAWVLETYQGHGVALEERPDRPEPDLEARSKSWDDETQAAFERLTDERA